MRHRCVRFGLVLDFPVEYLLKTADDSLAYRIVGLEDVEVLSDEMAQIRTVTVAGFLVQIGHDPRTVAIELNGEILKRDLFAATALGEGDRMEIVRFVQGG